MASLKRGRSDTMSGDSPMRNRRTRLPIRKLALENWEHHDVAHHERLSRQPCWRQSQLTEKVLSTSHSPMRRCTPPGAGIRVLPDIAILPDSDVASQYVGSCKDEVRASSRRLPADPSRRPAGGDVFQRFSRRAQSTSSSTSARRVPYGDDSDVAAALPLESKDVSSSDDSDRDLALDTVEVVSKRLVEIPAHSSHVLSSTSSSANDSASPTPCAGSVEGTIFSRYSSDIPTLISDVEQNQAPVGGASLGTRTSLVRGSIRTYPPSIEAAKSLTNVPPPTPNEVIVPLDGADCSHGVLPVGRERSNSSLDDAVVLVTEAASTPSDITLDCRLERRTWVGQVSRDETLDLRLVADRLAEQLGKGHHGCEAGEHEDAVLEHTEETQARGSQHTGLRDVYAGAQFPYVLAKASLLTAQEVDELPRVLPIDWALLFEGTPDAARVAPRQVCLHLDHCRAVRPVVTFDIPGCTGFATSLAFAVHGFAFEPRPHRSRRMQHGTSVGHQEPSDERSHLDQQDSPLRKVAHVFLGRVTGLNDIAVYVVFPHLPFQGSTFPGLSSRQYERWLDKVFLPAVHSVCRWDSLRNFPADARQATQASRTEGGQPTPGQTSASHGPSHAIAPDFLASVWVEVERLSVLLFDFENPKLFFAASFKQQSYGSDTAPRTLQETMLDFSSRIRDSIDLDFVDVRRMFIDLGKEVRPPSPNDGSALHSDPPEAQVYSWRRCCLNSYLSWLYDNQPFPTHTPTRRFYQQHFLRDACALTSLTEKRSRHRRGGLISSRFFSTAETAYGDGRSRPFADEALEELALDSRLRQSVQRPQGDAVARDIAPTLAAYLTSKRCIHSGTQRSREQSFGIREEHRVDLSLFLAIQRRICGQSEAFPCVPMRSTPPYVWAAQAATYFDFVSSSINKYCAAFELLCAKRRPKSVFFEHLQMKIMFLRCLRFATGAHQLATEPALWCSLRRAAQHAEQRPRRTFVGLGFTKTVSQYGFAWLEGRFDWQLVAVQDKFANAFLFGSTVLRELCSEYQQPPQTFAARSQQLDHFAGWLRAGRTNRAWMDAEVNQSIFLVLAEFQANVLDVVWRGLDRPREDIIGTDWRGFSTGYVRDVLPSDTFELCQNPLEAYGPYTVFDALFGDACSMDREWENINFRTLFLRLIAICRRICPVLARNVVFRTRDQLFRHNSLLPFPTSRSVVQTNQRGQYMFTGVHPVEGRPGEYEWSSPNTNREVEPYPSPFKQLQEQCGSPMTTGDMVLV